MMPLTSLSSGTICEEEEMHEAAEACCACGMDAAPESSMAISSCTSPAPKVMFLLSGTAVSASRCPAGLSAVSTSPKPLRASVSMCCSAVSSSAAVSASGCGATSGCRVSVVVRCSRSKLNFSSDACCPKTTNTHTHTARECGDRESVRQERERQSRKRKSSGPRTTP
jgi:hypothetical protein